MRRLRRRRDRGLRLGARIGWIARRRIARALKATARVGIARHLLGNAWLEYGLCLLLVPDRMQLETVALTSLFPDADTVSVTVDVLPEGEWRTTLEDLVVLLKIVRVAGATRALELGSYRGITAAYLVRNLPKHGTVVAVDADPEHGSAYRGTELERRIEHRVGAISQALFERDRPGSYELIFVDAGHTYEDVRRDTEIAMELVSEHGHIVWHDYVNSGYFNGYSGVPEYLNELAATKPVVHVAGSTLAIHSPAWERAGTGGGLTSRETHGS